jgi:hypothetical protein
MRKKILSFWKELCFGDLQIVDTEIKEKLETSVK